MFAGGVDTQTSDYSHHKPLLNDAKSDDMGHMMAWRRGERQEEGMKSNDEFGKNGKL